MEQPAFKKPRQHFDTSPRPVHVTFDDGKNQSRNFPWEHYIEGRWDYSTEPDTLKIELGDWVIVITGHNLRPLYLAIEERTLMRLRAQPELAERMEREAESFATEIHFHKATGKVGKRNGQTELELGQE
ncbi:hypothetical protein [Opitutus terrae]|uniref:Uncharacterized protein n=1 Tax=Opitutus terrae (strain DSM 11246 / JCM 15787 / PB90-1) TaxID=452637 RepID=B1ZPG3_OPITP|nr:hypothetical protein [Opitutus terrae]ACB74482.1 hypothetical protein Oter_1196 [Opitutus terrae PB90-1]